LLQGLVLVGRRRRRRRSNTTRRRRRSGSRSYHNGYGER